MVLTVTNYSLRQILNFFKNLLLTGSLFTLPFLTVFSVPAVYAQQSLEFGTDSVPGTNTGPTTSMTIELFHNSNNPSDNNFSTYLPTLTATITLDNQQFFVTQDTDDDAGTTNNPPIVMGWNFSPENPTIPNSDGTSRALIVPFSNLGESIDLPNSEVSSIAEYETFFSSLETTLNEGISFDSNYGVFIETGFEGLGINDQTYGGGRHRLADMTITFSQPVTDPVLHFFGLGGFWFYEAENDDVYFNTASTEFDFINSTADGAVSFEILSTSDGLGLAGGGTQIVNTWNVPDVIDEPGHEGEDSGVANGSVLVRGENITSLEFEVYARGITDVSAAQAAIGSASFIIGDETFGWNGDAGEEYGTYNIASDLFHFSISTQVDPDEVELTLDECYRMLSAPVEGTTYATLLDPIWTQGMTGADYTSGDPNVWLWPDVTGENEASWSAVPDLTATIPPGSGFLVSVFDDDDFDGIGDGFSKILSLTGSENAPLTFTAMNSDATGWTMLGNPFKSTIDWDDLIAESGTQNIEDAVYVYDRNLGSYRSYSSIGGGDLTDGLIAPFQGFFVQNSGTGSQVDFTNDVKSSTDGTFYGKDRELNNFVRLEVNGESLYNSVWVHFSDQGATERTRGDALELMPLASEYALLGTRKADGTIFDIGHYPIPDEDFEIPVSLETTRSGTFTITATDLDLSFGSDLYFIDLELNESIRIDESFTYQFSTAGVAAKSGNDMLNRCSVDSPQKAKTVATTDRFVIATSPKEFGSELPQALALNQNYPNPFNPTTQISYELPQQSDVRLEVYDLVGRQVATLVSQAMEAGAHTVNFDASNLSSGVYIYRLNAGSTVISRKLTVIK